MSGLFLSKGLYPQEFFKPTIEFLLKSQLADGSIPWFEGSYADPWDHVEAAMGLSIGIDLVLPVLTLVLVFAFTQSFSGFLETHLR